MEGRERELKLLAVSAGQLDTLARREVLGGLPLTAEGEREQEDVYLDTEDYRLLRAGLSLRRRSRPDGHRLTIKEVLAAGERSVLCDRKEIEETVKGRLPIADLPPTGAIGERIRALIGKRELEPVVRLKTRRRLFRLGVGMEDRAELCLDEVEIGSPGGDTVARFHEVEVEDHGLGDERLDTISAELRLGHLLQPSGMSKLERGLAASGLLLEARGASETFEVALDQGDRLVDAAYRVFRRHFERMRANEAGTRLGDDAEFLHDMRVSTRRLRAAFRTFRSAFGKPRLAGFNGHLRWIARALGEVRDLDVYLERLPEYADGLSEEERPALEPFQSQLVKRRGAARRRMLRVLDSRRFESFVERFDAFLRRGPAKRPRLAPARAPIVEAAPRKIRRTLKTVLQRGRSIPAESPPAQDLHELRILCKRLRYTCEFFRELYGKGMRRFIRSVVELQDLLGAHQDACMAGDVLRDAANRLPVAKSSVRQALALGQLISAQDRSAAASRAGFRMAWKAFDRKGHRRRMWD